MSEEKKKVLRIVTPEATLSFPRVEKATKVDPTNENEEPKFSAVFIFPKGTDFTQMKAVIMHVGETRWGAKFKEMLKTGQVKSPLRKDGNPKYFPEGAVYISPRSKNKPGLVMPYPDEKGQPALCEDPSIFYAGARVRANVTAFAYDRLGNKGVSFGLNSIQWIGDGPRLDGGDPQNDFDTLEEAPMMTVPEDEEGDADDLL